MNHLTDIEELIAKVQNQDVRPFIAEAAKCYAAGAHRGAIVIAALALFDDLKRKVNELAPINSAARTLNDEIGRRAAAQEIYESYLSDQLAAIGIISVLEKGILDKIRDHRNKAAHPSGHNPSAEEARYVIHEVVTKFLEKADLYTTQRADWILNGLKSDNYFPTNRIEDINRVVGEELTNLHPGAFQYLVSKVAAGVAASTGKENDNQRFFLIGLSAISNGNSDLAKAVRKNLIERCVDKSAFTGVILGALHTNPKLALPEGDATFLRISAMLSGAILAMGAQSGHSFVGHPVALFSSITNELKPDFVARNLSEPLSLLIEHALFDGEVIKVALSVANMRPVLLSKIRNRTSSIDFGTANAAAERIVGVDHILAEGLSDVECLGIVTCVVSAAKSNAWSAQRLANSRFTAVPHIKAKALGALGRISEPDFQVLVAQVNLIFPSKAEFQAVYM